MKIIKTFLTVTTAQLHPQFLASLKAPNPWLHSVKMILLWFNSTDIKCLSNTFAFEKIISRDRRNGATSTYTVGIFDEKFASHNPFLLTSALNAADRCVSSCLSSVTQRFVPSKIRRQHRRKSSGWQSMECWPFPMICRPNSGISGFLRFLDLRISSLPSPYLKMMPRGAPSP